MFGQLHGGFSSGRVQGSDDRKSQAFRDTAVILKRRIELMLALPLQTLDKMALQREGATP